jgi:peptide/nickel transport system substrate-binding protein
MANPFPIRNPIKEEKKMKTLKTASIVLVVAVVLLSACARTTPEVVEKEVPVTVEVEKEVPVTVEKEVTVEVVITPTPAEVAVARCPSSTVADPMGLDGGEGHQFELAEYEELAGCKVTFTENPLFADQDLPPVEERLPEEPLVVQPYDEIGKYGGRWRGLAIALESGTSESISLRQPSIVRLADDLHTIVPDVAKSWQWNNDFTEITFVLRKGHKWSDGEPFTADDIVFWWEDIVLNEDYPFAVPAMWKPGGEPAKLEKIDDVTVRFTFAAPNPGLLVALSTSPFNEWAPKHFMEQFHIKYNPEANELAKQEGFEDWTLLFGSYWDRWADAMNRPGVPTLHSHILARKPTTEDRLFVANPYYFKVDTAGQQLPYINEHNEKFIPDREVWNLKIIAGEVDEKGQNLALTDYPLLKENEAKGNYTVQLNPGGSGEGALLVFNRTHPDPVLREIFSDVRWNQAMSLALNREEINEMVYLGLAVSYQAVPDISVPFVEDWMTTYMTEYDPEQANELLDEMGLERGADGWRRRPDGEPLIIFYEYCQQACPVSVHPLVKEYWETVGVQVKLKEISSDAWQTRMASNEADIAVWGNDHCFEPAILEDPSIQLCPSWGALTGIPWEEWYKSGGESGEEPPDDVKRLFELQEELPTTMPGSDEYLAIGKEMVEINLDNMFRIGTVGGLQVPTVVHNRLGNVPYFTAQIGDYFRTRSFGPYQWYIKESE